MKTYFEYMNEFDKDDIYESLLGYGMFSDKLPTCFSSEDFYKYCLTRTNSFNRSEYNYVVYNNIRNINIPRELAIPNPMAYQRLCKCIADEWDLLKDYFYDCTSAQEYKVSRIHIRKLHSKKAIFEMNYSNWKLDGSIDSKLSIGMKYVVYADIAKCFPSIYTHSISWALVGKEVAKNNRHWSRWFNKIDKACQNVKYGETNGILIGPHTSNIISEIILCKIDKILTDEGWKYVRNIDDYQAYVKSEEEANQFLTKLQQALSEYNLQLNHKKTRISKLPLAISQSWFRKMDPIKLMDEKKEMNYKACQKYLDDTIEIASKEQDNASVYKYAFRVLKNKKLTENARKYEQDIAFHLSLIFPYLVPLLDEFIFDVCNTSVDEKKFILNRIYNEYLPKLIYEPVIYSIYWAILYDLELVNMDVNTILQTNNSVLMLLSFIYFKKSGNNEPCLVLKNQAENLLQDKEEFEKNWIFVYEVLPADKFSDDWKALKNNDVSFLTEEMKNILNT